MKAEIKKAEDAFEFETHERCFIIEASNDNDDPDVSIARARVAPGNTTAWHKLEGVAERYLIIQGRGLVEIEEIPPTNVTIGDVVKIPEGKPQRIHNMGDEDLIFYAICSPRFTQSCYVDLESDDYHLSDLPI